MTSGNGSNVPKVTVSIPQDGKSKEPRPKVKPHVLTHLIGGFVIQEGARPFPVERPSFAIDSLTRPSCQLERGSLKMASEMEDLSALELKAKQDSMLTCELCGRVDFAHIFKGSKRFCSTLCAKRYNVGCTRRMGLFPNRKTTVDNLKKQKGINRNHKCSAFESKNKKPVSMQKPATGSLSSGNSTCPAQEQSSRCSRASSYDAAIHDPPDLYPFLSQSFLPSDPGKWNVENVYRFIRSLPGCAEIAEEFRSQEIDGQALLLLKEDHLMGTMNIKLGPALKIFAQISVLKES